MNKGPLRLSERSKGKRQSGCHGNWTSGGIHSSITSFYPEQRSWTELVICLHRQLAVVCVCVDRNSGEDQTGSGGCKWFFVFWIEWVKMFKKIRHGHLCLVLFICMRKQGQSGNYRFFRFYTHSIFWVHLMSLSLTHTLSSDVCPPFSSHIFTHILVRHFCFRSVCVFEKKKDYYYKLDLLDQG